MGDATVPVVTGNDDAVETSAGSVSLTNTSGNVNSSDPVLGLIFRSVPIPPGDVVTESYVNLYLISTSNDTPNLTARAEINPADFAATSNNLSGRTKTAEGVVWNENLAISGAGFQSSVDFAAVIQEIVDDGGWSENDDIAIFLIDNGGGGLLRINTYDAGGIYAPELYVAWTAAGELTYAWPGDYWPDAYWSEYWPDYGVGSPPSGIIPLVMHHLKQQGVS